MNVDAKNIPANNVLSDEDYSRAMNFIGQNLLSSLTQSVEKLSPELRNRKVVTQGLAAFLANVIHKQFPDDSDLCQQMLNEFSNHVRVQLENV
ncbi:MAG: hypothetical protein H0U73_13875 [Tatlockia sp.]|nr:hypothetical protein [Tatlockia sp.]